MMMRELEKQMVNEKAALIKQMAEETKEEAAKNAREILTLLDTPDLQLPHPRMQLRRFVLQPLAEIIPDFLHPKFHKTVAQLLSECSDEGRVELFL